MKMYAGLHRMTKKTDRKDAKRRKLREQELIVVTISQLITIPSRLTD